MGGDLLLAAEQLAACGAGVRAVVIRGAGAHFSPGGNHYRNEGDAPLAAAAAALRRLFAGFAALQALAVPLVCAVHGTVIGGGIAACLNCDYIVAEVPPRLSTATSCAASARSAGFRARSRTRQAARARCPCTWATTHSARLRRERQRSYTRSENLSKRRTSCNLGPVPCPNPVGNANAGV